MASCSRFPTVGALCALTLTLASATANATPTFPSVIAEHLVTSEPPCAICHIGPQQRGTVNTSFGVSMRGRGLVAFDEASLRTALDALAAERIDSDADGVSDVDEIQMGTDPNAAPGDTETITPIYGCGLAKTERSDGTWIAIGALVVGVSFRRRRRRARRSRK